jgi:DnaJ-class molecular chaperone
LNPEDESAKKNFQAVQNAYEVLSDPNKREMYDRYGSSFESLGGGGPREAGRGGPASARFEDVDLSQFFEERFGEQTPGGFADMFKQFTRGGESRRSRAARQPRRGRNIRHELTVPFQTSVAGGQVPLTVHGANGHVKSISVKIPRGIDDGQTIRLRGQGEPGASGGPAGDLLITVRAAPHPCYQRHGNDLAVKVPVTLSEAALGAKVDIPTPQGTITLKIPPGTSSGKRFRIRGHGVVAANGKAGDLLAEAHIVLPDQLDKEALELIKKIDSGQQNPRSRLRW